MRRLLLSLLLLLLIAAPALAHQSSARLFGSNPSGATCTFGTSPPLFFGGAWYYCTDDAPDVYAALPGGGASTFVSLTDTPVGFAGESLKYVRVNAGETALEFAAGSGGASDFVSLTDTPGSYAGEGGKLVAVNSTPNGLEFITVVSLETALEAVLDLPDLQGTLTDGQIPSTIARDSELIPDDQDATEVPYTPTTGTDWTDPDPVHAAEGLDDLAGRLTVEEAKADDDVPEQGDFGAAADLDANGAILADSVGTSELDDLADTPLAGEYLRVATGAAAVEYRTTAEVLADIGGASSTHAATHSDGGADEVSAENLASSCGSGAPLEGDGAGGLVCGTDDTGTPGADSIGTSELDDGADTPGSGEYLRVDTVDQAGVEYRTTAEVLADIGAASTSHAATHSDGGSDEVTVENLASACGSGATVEGDGAGGLTCGTDATATECSTAGCALNADTTVPSGTAPTTNAAGELAVDTNGDGTNITTAVVQFHDGTGTYIVFPIREFPTVNGQIPKFNSANGDMEWSTDATGGTPSFDTITTGTNTGATMTVANGASIVVTEGGEVEATQAIIMANNDTGNTIHQCAPVYIAGFDTPSQLPLIAIADADNSAQMPAVGLAYETITTGNSGRVIVAGQFSSLDTATGEGWVEGESIYVSDTGGTTSSVDCGEKLTNVKPTGATDQIQKIGQVVRAHGTAGKLTIVGAGRSNDVPNIAAAKLWLGNASGVATAVTLTGDVSVDNAGVVTVVDDSHAHVVTDIDAFTEAQLEARVSDATDVFTNNDGALADDNLADDDLSALQDVVITTPALNHALIRNGSSQWVNDATPAFDGTDISNVDAQTVDGLDGATQLCQTSGTNCADGSATNEIEVVNEAVSTANFDGDTTSAASQDALHDHLVVADADLDGLVEKIDTTTNGFVTTTGGTGTLSIDTSTYLTTEVNDLTAAVAGLLPLANLTDSASTDYCLVAGGAGGDPNYKDCNTLVSHTTDTTCTTGTNCTFDTGDNVAGAGVTFSGSVSGSTVLKASGTASGTVTLPAETGTACTTGSVCSGYEADTHAAEHASGGGDAVDHNTLTNYDAAEHVDWSLASQGTIHATNYVDDDAPEDADFGALHNPTFGDGTQADMTVTWDLLSASIDPSVLLEDSAFYWGSGKKIGVTYGGNGQIQLGPGTDNLTRCILWDTTASNSTLCLNEGGTPGTTTQFELNKKLDVSGALNVSGNSTYSADVTIQGQLAMATNTPGNLLIGDGSDYEETTVTGDVTINSSGVTAIGTGKVTADDIADGAVVLADMAQMSSNGLIGNDNGTNQDPQHLTIAESQALLNVETVHMVISPGYLSTDGTGCTAPTERQLNSGPKQWVVNCTDTGTPTLYFSAQFREWDAGTINVELIAENEAATPSGNYEFDWVAMCLGTDDDINNLDWSATSRATTLNFTSGTQYGNEFAATGSSIDPDQDADITCADGDMVYVKGTFDSTASTTTQESSIYITGLRVYYTRAN